MTLFSESELTPPAASRDIETPAAADAPLAARMRPRNFDEFAGQVHLVAPGAPLRRTVEAGRVPSALFWGPAGTGKTTLARLMSGLVAGRFVPFSAVTGNVADVRRIVSEAAQFKARGTRTVLFVDEIHRFNRAQQDAFLPHVEDGTITLLGATTENPLATVNTPLLSRCRLFRFEPLQPADIIALLERALSDPRGLGEMALRADDAALQHISEACAGDARWALGALELCADLAGTNGQLSLALAREATGRRGPESGAEAHYTLISAYIKSLRGSDPDAALYWMARLLEGGEDPLFIARRLVIQASEDVGMADSRALTIALAALQALKEVGLPEGAIPLSHATIYVACAPKSNAAYVALRRAQEAARATPSLAVPAHLRPASLPGARERQGAGENYQNPHRDNASEQTYLPPELEGSVFYEPTERAE